MTDEASLAGVALTKQMQASCERERTCWSNLKNAIDDAYKYKLIGRIQLEEALVAIHYWDKEWKLTQSTSEAFRLQLREVIRMGNDNQALKLSRLS